MLDCFIYSHLNATLSKTLLETSTVATMARSEDDSDDLPTRIMHASLTTFLSNLTQSYATLCTSLPRSLTSFSSALDLFRLSCVSLTHRAQLFPLQQYDNLHSLCDFPSATGCGQAAEWAVGKYWGETASECLLSEYAERYMVDAGRLREAVASVKVGVVPAAEIPEAVARRPQVGEGDEGEEGPQDEGMTSFPINAPPV